MRPKGIVYLVGAGPGDPGLITLKGVACLKKADVVLYDYLANPRLLAWVVSPRAKKIYVGKKGASHSRGQDAINALLIREAKRGKTVVRLKGGDPFIFGRGGEEALALAEAGVPFEIIPGVTSAVAVPAYAGIPLTHRDLTSSVAFVTGHEQDQKGLFPPDFHALSKIGTVVFLMGHATLPMLVSKLIAAGRSPDTPAAIIQWGTWPRQKTIRAPLAALPEKVREAGIKPPTITVVGEVASLADPLGWYERKPLFGKKILVTRSAPRSEELVERLKSEGAHVWDLPTIEIRPSPQNLKPFLRKLPTYDWLVFTSANAISVFFDTLRKEKTDRRRIATAKIAVIGPGTARALEDEGYSPDLSASPQTAEGLIKAFSRFPLKNKKILFPRGETGRDVLPNFFRSRKAKLDVVPVYRSAFPRRNRDRLREIMDKDTPDLLIFASSLAVENFAEALNSELRKKTTGLPALCIGPITGKTAAQNGFNPIVAARPTVESLLRKATFLLLRR